MCISKNDIHQYNTTSTYLKIPEVLFMDDSDKKNHNGFYASLYTSRTLLKIRHDSFSIFLQIPFYLCNVKSSTT